MAACPEQWEAKRKTKRKGMREQSILLCPEMRKGGREGGRGVGYTRKYNNQVGGKRYHFGLFLETKGRKKFRNEGKMTATLPT